MLIQNVLLIIILFFFFWDGCEAKPNYQKVTWVYDGDTLRLADGRKIRLIGMNAPEVAHHQKKGQPYGREATETLRALLKKAQYRVRLERGKQAKDRYKRHLAHVFLPDGTDISQWMLRNGWATVMIFPPNVRYITAYRAAERSAQLKKRNIWQQTAYQLKAPRQLKPVYRGYVRLKSTVRHIKVTKHTIMLEIDKNIFIKLRTSYLHYFTRYDPKKLLHQEVIVRGFLQKYRGKRIIRVRHPVQLTYKTKALTTLDL
jgi:endonuclease YncB( thermonuclease family)